jgi:hypothetical protein
MVEYRGWTRLSPPATYHNLSRDLAANTGKDSLSTTFNLCAYYSNMDPDEIRLEHSNRAVKPVNNRNVTKLNAKNGSRITIEEPRSYKKKRLPTSLAPPPTSPRLLSLL